MLMQWTIRENQNRSSELLHYGVKGMKWGVRKEKETSGTRSSSGTITGGPDSNPKVVSKKEFEKGAGLSSTPKQGQNTSEIAQATSMYKTARNALRDDPAFSQWLKKNGKYDSFTKDSTAFENYINSSGVGKLINQKSAIEAAANAYNIYIEYDQDPSAHMTDEERENQEELIKMQEELLKSIKSNGIELHEKQHVYMDWSEGAGYLIYDDGFGNKYAVNKDDIGILVDKMKVDAAKLKDVRNSRRREKNVDSSVSSVKLTKRERTDPGKESEKKEQVGAKTTYLATKDAKNKAIKRARLEGSLERISNSTEILNKQLSKIQSSGKKASQSGSVKKTMTQTISKTMKSAESSIKKSAQFVRDFLKNPFNIQTNVTTTTTTLAQKKK